MNTPKKLPTATDDSALEQWLSYLESIHPSAIDMGLTRVEQVAERLKLQFDNTLLITVAGTNGKGTTCRFLEQALLAQGKRVAVYGSPHLVSYRERVRFNGEWADSHAFCQAFQAIEAARKEITLTYFEFGTLAAIKMMQDWQADVVILEVGLGGRLDATNILDANLAVITTIDLDHQDYLGDTREKIATEKAGIMRENGKAVIGELRPPDTLFASVNERNVDAVWAQKDFYSNGSAPLNQQGQWDWQGKHSILNSLPAPHIPFQNVCTALAALEAIEMLPSNAIIQNVIANTRLPGRQQLLRNTPKVVVDVAHNPQATKAMLSWLQGFQANKIHAVVGMLKDKSIAETLAPLSQLNAQWYVASTEGARGCEADVLTSALESAAVPASAISRFNGVAPAYESALKHCENNELVLVFGSFITVAAVMTHEHQHS